MDNAVVKQKWVLDIMKLIVLIITILAFPLLSSGNTCVDLFNDSTLVSKVFSPEFLKYSSRLISDVETVRVAPQKLIESGESFNILEKIGPLWESRYRKSKNDVQGDPRFFPIVMGPQVAYDFGFRYLSENKITIPTTVTFNRRIEKLDRSLRSYNLEGIKIRFYETDGKPFGGEDYLRRFIENSELPLSDSGHLAVHDFSYHSLAIMIPKVFLETAIQSITFILNLKHDLQNDPRLSVEEKQIALRACNSLIDKAVQTLDNSTGSISKILAEKISDPSPENQRKGNSTFYIYVTEDLQNRFYKLPRQENIQGEVDNIRFGERKDKRAQYNNIYSAIARVFDKRSNEIPKKPTSFTMDEVVNMFETRINIFKLFSHYGKID